MKVLALFIGGFRENMRKSTGLEDIVRGERQKWDDDQVRITDPYHWDADAKGIARRNARIIRDEQCKPNIVIAAYSWGSPTAVKVAKEFKKLGHKVDYVVLCDPVHRSKWLPFWWLEWRAMTRYPKHINFPDNVMNLYGVYQRNNRPWGRRPRVKGHEYRLRQFHKLDEKHVTIDSSKEFAVMVNKVLMAAMGNGS